MPSGKSWGAYLSFAVVFVGNVVAQSVQNICLPIILSPTNGVQPDMSVTLVYISLICYMFFSVLDVLLDLLPGAHCFSLPQSQLVTVGLHNALNGIGLTFGGSSSRTPLTMQMSGTLAVSLTAPFYKMWVFGLSASPSTFGWKGYISLLIAAIGYIVAFILTLLDKINNVSSGSLSPFCILFWLGVGFGVTFNVHQEKLMRASFDEAQQRSYSFMDYFRLSVSLLRRQTGWVFIFTWIAVGLDAIDGVGQTNLTEDTFTTTWSMFLPFGSAAMNIYNLAYFVNFTTGVFMNRFDSSFNLICGNLSAILCLWTGWVPSLRDDTVGFSPSIPLTVTAIVVSVVAIYPSYLYSLEMQTHLDRHLSGGHSEGTKAEALLLDSESIQSDGINGDAEKLVPVE